MIRNILAVAAGCGVGYLLATQPLSLATVSALVIAAFLLRALRKDRRDNDNRLRQQVEDRWFDLEYQAVCRGEIFHNPVVTEDFINQFHGR